MPHSDNQRGEKRGDLSTDRAQALGKTKEDADADAADDTSEE